MSTMIRSFPLAFPSTVQQSEIVESLSALDAKQESHRRKHATLSGLFNTLLHQLMTAVAKTSRSCGDFDADHDKQVEGQEPCL